MRRRKSAETQLAIEWTEAMRWEDLPASLRERVREQLGVLLQRAARPTARIQETGDDE